MKQALTLITTLVCLLPLSAMALSQDAEKTYIIGREDVLDVTVWQSPDLTKAVTVRSDGTVDYPLLGPLDAAGKTPAELQKIIQEKLAQGYVNNPQVNVAIKEYNSKRILVFGEVEKPGLYKLKGEIPLLELLFMVGGVKSDAKRMTVIRGGEISSEAVPTAMQLKDEEESEGGVPQAQEIDLIALLSKGDLSQNVVIKPGDTIYVSSGTGERYYVLGQVKQPGPYEWVQNISVLEAIKLAGGLTERAAGQRIKIRKNHGGMNEEIKVNVSDIMKGKKKDDVIVKAGDTIVVPESWI